MFTRKSMLNEELDRVIADALKQLDYVPAYSEEYFKILSQVERLNTLKNTSSFRVSPDTLAVVIGNFLGIALIVGHERAHVVTSKALQFVQKAAH